MKINELIQTGTKVAEFLTPILDEDGNETGEFEITQKEIPIMETVYRDMTPEEIAKAEEEAANIPEPEPSPEEQIAEVKNRIEGLAEEVSDATSSNEDMMDAIVELAEILSELLEAQSQD